MATTIGFAVVMGKAEMNQGDLQWWVKLMKLWLKIMNKTKKRLEEAKKELDTCCLSHSV